MATLLLGAAVVTAAGGAAASGAAAAAMYYRKKQQQKRAVFGKELEQLRERHLTGAPWYLPIVVEETVSWLEDNHLDEEGLFRISGSLAAVNELVDKYNSGKKVDLSDQQPATVAGVLKYFLRELDNPLIPYELYLKYISANGELIDANHGELIRLSQALVRELPLINQRVLARLTRFLLKVSQHSQQNKMTVENLSIVFGPCFIWMNEDSDTPMDSVRMSLMAETPRISMFTTALLRFGDAIFTDAMIAELLEATAKEHKKKGLFGGGAHKKAPSAKANGAVAASNQPHALELQSEPPIAPEDLAYSYTSPLASSQSQAENDSDRPPPPPYFAVDSSTSTATVTATEAAARPVRPPRPARPDRT